MSRLKLSYTSVARAQLRSIGEFTKGKWGEKQRELYLAKLLAGIEAICKSPKKGRPRNDLYDGMLSWRIEKGVTTFPALVFLRFALALHEKTASEACCWCSNPLH